MAINRQKWMGIACGACCALCIALYLASVRGEVDAARAEALERYGGDQVEVCVAKRDLNAGELVESSAIVQKLWVADLLPEGAISDPAQIVGRRLGSTIIKGEVICEGRTELSESSLSVPAGKAAISVPARAVQAVGGSVEPGMEVDVYATGPVSTTRIVAGALVLASSASSEGTSPSSSEWVTLAIDPEHVQEVVAAAQNLELYFALPAVGGETTSAEKAPDSSKSEALAGESLGETGEGPGEAGEDVAPVPAPEGAVASDTSAVPASAEEVAA